MKEPHPLATVTENGVRFATGIPVRFSFIRNTEPAPRLRRGFPDHFQEKLGPNGRYMLHDAYPSQLPRGWERGTVTFHNPLVIELTTNPDDIYGPGSWKAHLAKHFRAKKRSLSLALIRAGYDGVVTVARHRTGSSTSEIVDLTTFDPSRR